MSAYDIELLRKNSICVVVSSDPAKVKFLDPIPSASSRTDIENAAIQLSRRLFRGDLFPDNRRDFAKLYMDCLIKGTSLDPMPQQAEQEKAIFDSTKAEEIRKMAREEAKAERIIAKQKANPKP